jgi:signal transduction histidine kinase/ActR/RegA family two-component response regulator
MRSFSIRSRSALTLVALNVVAIGVLAFFAYRASRDTLTAQAVATARVVADSRGDALTRALERQQDRLQAFLTSVESLCGERAASGAVAFERECARVALRGFRNAEHAVAVELYSGPRRVVAAETWPETAAPPTPPRLAAIGGLDDSAIYTMQATRQQLAVRAVFPLSDLASTFIDRSGLKTRGELLLTDGTGRVIVPLGAQGEKATVPPALLSAVRQCAASPQHDDPDAGGELILGPEGKGLLAGVRPVPAISDGCIVARLDYQEALAPMNRLGRIVVIASITVTVLSVLLSLIIARNADQAQQEHEARIAAEAANRSKDDFLATVSHELRTPLTAILGWASILRRHQPNAARFEHALRVIERNARMEARLIDDLLDVTGTINGQIKLNPSTVSAVNVVEAAIEAIAPAAESKGVQVTNHVEGMVADVQVDPQRLQQVVWNLLANAIRFTPKDGWVDVAVRQTHDATQIIVGDTGTGISADFLPHVFDRFRQGQSGTMRSHGGLGLGLSIVRHLVELHGGTVTAESPGLSRGATFTVTLPRTASAPVSAAPRRPAVGEHFAISLPGACVLVVDDDTDTREVVREILQYAGAKVITSGSARETRALIERFQPDVLIADIGMPDEDGYSLIAKIRENEPAGRHLPAIALTAHTRPEDVEHALKAGFHAHVAKPVDASQLVSSIVSLLRPAA